MGMAWPPGVDVAPAVCRNPSMIQSPESKPTNKMSLDVIAPQEDNHYPTIDQFNPHALPPVAHGPVAPSLGQSQDISSLPPTAVEPVASLPPSYGSPPDPAPSDGGSEPATNAMTLECADIAPSQASPSIRGTDDTEVPGNDPEACAQSKPSHDAPTSAPSSPLSPLPSLTEDTTLMDTPPSQNASSSPEPKSNAQPVAPPPEDIQIDFDHEGPEGHQILRLKPTVSQWNDFPAILSIARRLGAENDGCFKVLIPSDMLEPLPERSSQKAPANAYQIRQVKRNGFWRVSTVPSEGLFNCPSLTPESLEPVETEVQKLKKLFNKNKDKQLRSVRYRVDIPAWTVKQRLLAGVPERSPIHPLKGDKLDFTKAIIPGIHTPYVYESAAFFGATFQIHAEDYRLASLNHLYKGRKIWIVVPSTAVDQAEEVLGRKKKCSQFMRHRAEFFFPDKLTKLGVPFRIVDQRPGETIVILPDAYHEGFSTGYTIAEAKNYAESDWTTSTYQACDEKCQLLTAIPAAYMKLLGEGEERLDLCARYGDDEVSHIPKRLHDESAQALDSDREMKRAKVQ
ncbi:Lysine-specific demethylase 4D [Paramyrothecium foliicola]|nr:Lysine-specific demethylase 4D [Paramyrothecium foliicola]